MKELPDGWTYFIQFRPMNGRIEAQFGGPLFLATSSSSWLKPNLVARGSDA